MKKSAFSLSLERLVGDKRTSTSISPLVLRGWRLITMYDLDMSPTPHLGVFPVTYFDFKQLQTTSGAST